MKFYGLHWTTDGGRPLQAKIEAATGRISVRFCDAKGKWSKWRRVDVERLESGVLKETADKANSAKSADTAKRLARTVTISLSGALTGSGKMDGSGDVEIATTAEFLNTITELGASLKSLGDRVTTLEGTDARLREDLHAIRTRLDALEGKDDGGGTGGELADLKNRVAALEASQGGGVNSETITKLVARQKSLVGQMYALLYNLNMNMELYDEVYNWSCPYNQPSDW